MIKGGCRTGRSVFERFTDQARDAVIGAQVEARGVAARLDNIEEKLAEITERLASMVQHLTDH